MDYYKYEWTPKPTNQPSNTYVIARTQEVGTTGSVRDLSVDGLSSKDIEIYPEMVYRRRI